MKNHWLLAVLATMSALSTVSVAAENEPARRPNIVWVVVEDMSDHFGCYGETTIATPNVDRLAAEGVLFRNAFVTAPVCSTCRSALITGMYQTTIGAHHHRSGRGAVKLYLPEHVRLIPQIFKDSGYWTSNGDEGILTPGPTNRKKPARIAKTDYNFEFDPQVYDSNDWRGRAKGQPFFAQIQLRGGKARTLDTPHPISPAKVKLPAYYPDDPVIREDWAMYLNSVMNTDIAVGTLLARLERDGDLDNTYIFFMTDHGISHARGKQFVYEEGMKIPLIVRGPGLKAARKRDDLVVHIDMAATSLAFAAIQIPEYLESVDLFADDYKARNFVVSARDRCDETVDRLRGVRTARFKYIRNYLPDRPYLQPNAYKDNKSIIKAMRRLHADGQLDAAQSLIMRETRPPEELFDLKADPLELHNLAGDESHAKVLAEHRSMLDHWTKETSDQGMHDEPAKVYDSDMKIYLDTMKVRRPERFEEIAANVALMKKWASEGK
jgi:arylsulfatase A-like enzyme